jgi:flagellar basal-body rod modification protein FlgD
MATNNVTDATSSYAALIAGKSSDSSTTKASASEDMQTRFMTLLMTQLKNQDPLNPTDANQMTAQLSQISTVSGIEKLNATMDKLLESYSGTQNMQAAGMIGKTVLIAGNGMELGEGGALGGVSLDAAAEMVTVTIKDAAGNVVQTQELGAQGAGVMNFVWDGKSDKGEAMPVGDYTFSVKASTGGAAIASTALQAGMVSALTMAKDGVSLQLLGNKTIAYSDILQIMN